MTAPPSPVWFDAHLDLAYMEAAGRDMTALPEVAGGPDLPAAVTLPSLNSGGVRACLGTIFVEPDGTPPAIAYPSGDAESAHAAGWRQIEIYKRWEREGRISLRSMGPRAVRSAPIVGTLNVGILIEGADPIREPSELVGWVEAGVVATGLAWAKSSRYAGGNTSDLGITDLGRRLIAEMDRLGVVHDASHLSDRAFDELCAATTRPIIASHSNCRALVHDGRADESGVPAFQRHLKDDQIREIVRRGGVIGVNVFSPFLIRGGKRDRRAAIAEWCDHVARVCEIAGDRVHVGLGSDMDGGFSALALPEGIDGPASMGHLLDGLRERGFSAAELTEFAWGNWARFWGLVAAVRPAPGPRTSSSPDPAGGPART
ncbi:MAG: dipeptidase [Phycisphaerales bacterium]